MELILGVSFFIVQKVVKVKNRNRNMLDYGAGGQGNFAAMPRVVKGKPSFKDPYGTNVE